MLDSVLFSVLIANFNNGHYISAAIDSVLMQDFLNWEIVIVDDNSTDNSEEVILKYIERGVNIKYYKNSKNSGVGYTKNKCVEYANGVICGFLDPDDALIENCISQSVRCHLSFPEVSLVYSNCYLCDENLNIKFVQKGKKNIGKTFLESIVDGVTVNHFASFKKEFYLKTTGINSRLLAAEDYDLYYKLEEVAPLYYLDSTLYKYRIHRNGLSNGSNTSVSIVRHIEVIIYTCIRRNIPFEDIVLYRVKTYFSDRFKNQKDYRLGHFLLLPFRTIKKLFKGLKK